MHLTKHHALGNDFLVVLGEVASERRGPLAVALCHRRRGIGADGLIVARCLEPGHATFDLHNSDGSPAEISGNGLRCVGQALTRATGTDGHRVETAAGTRRVERVSGDAAATAVYRVTMGPVTLLDPPDEAQRAGLERAVAVPILALGRAEIGNPHVVVRVDEPDAVDLVAVGEAAQQMFGPVNLHVIGPVDLTAAGDTPVVAMRSFERGVGVTAACGSGACVTATLVAAWDGLGPSFAVDMPGGTARVTVGADVILEGPTTHVADIDVPGERP